MMLNKEFEKAYFERMGLPEDCDYVMFVTPDSFMAKKHADTTLKITVKVEPFLPSSRDGVILDPRNVDQPKSIPLF